MAFYGGYQQPQYFGYGQPMDNLAQLRQQQMQQPQLFPTQMSAATGDDRIWIQGEVGAKGYIVAPGNTVTLWDSESQSIFLKSVNAAGIPSMQVLHYSFEEPQKKQEIELDKYVTKEEFEERLKALMEAKTDVQ